MKSFYSDYGIDINDPDKCPRCDQFGLEINQDKGAWYCISCHWKGRLEEVEKPIMDAQEAGPNLLRWYQDGMPPTFGLGWKDMDELLKIRRGEWTIVTGYASHGKSQLVDAIMINTMDLHEWKWAIFSPENVPHESHNKSLLQKFLGKRFKGSKDATPANMTEAEIKLGMSWLKQRLFYVNPTTPTFEAVLAQFEKLVKDQKIQAVLIDPVNEIDHDIPPGMTETMYMAKKLIQFRKFCEKAHVHGFIVAHPAKQGAGKRSSGDEGETRPIVRLADISGTAHFENKAFNGISVWRNPSADGAEKHFNHIYVLKVRNQDCGTTGKEVLTWDPESTCYFGKSEMGPSTPPAAKAKERLGRLYGGDWTKASITKADTSFNFGANTNA